MQKIILGILGIGVVATLGFLLINKNTQKSDQKKPTEVPAKPATVSEKCFIGGCSSQICSDRTDIVSTCEYREEYACYQTAKCERQGNGECGLTQTSVLTACLSK